MSLFVETFDGSQALKSNCRKIQEIYYEKDRQCFLMSDGKWHRINNGRIALESRSQKYVFISDELTSGIIGKNPDGTLKMGFFKSERAKDVTVVSGGLILNCIDRETMENLDAIECYGNGAFIMGKTEIRGDLRAKRIFKGYNLLFDYRCDSLLEIFTNSFQKFFKGRDIKFSFYKQLPNITFGIEYETNNGRIPEDLIFQNGLIPVRDGSLRNEEGTQPYEYATVILSGKTGFEAINMHSELLNKYCVNHYLNSLHVHIGNIPLTKEYIYSLYLVGQAIEDEVYEMFPQAMKKTSTFKKRDYCSPLTKLQFKTNDVEGNFNHLYQYLAMDANSKFEGYQAKHPRDRDLRSKWNIETRYTWMNFVPLLFGNNKTCEFRIHTSTFNDDKIINWIFLISAICEFANRNQERISELDKMERITLNDIIYEIYGDKNDPLSSFLSAYVEYRKKLMESHSISGDTVGSMDVKYDDIEAFDFPINSLIK